MNKLEIHEKADGTFTMLLNNTPIEHVQSYVVRSGEAGAPVELEIRMQILSETHLLFDDLGN